MKGIRAFLFLIIAALLLMAPVHARAYTNIHLDSFQSIISGELTGEIHYTVTGGIPGGPILSPGFSYCVDRWTDVYVPGKYYAEAYNITAPPPAHLSGQYANGGLKAAWLIDNYSYSLHPGVLGSSYTPQQQGVIVQLAVWDVTGQGTPVVGGYPGLYTKAAELEGLIPTTAHALDYLANQYRWLRLYADSTNRTEYQDLMAPVPIPSALWLLGPGLVGLVGIRRRMKK